MRPQPNGIVEQEHRRSANTGNNQKYKLKIIE